MDLALFKNEMQNYITKLQNNGFVIFKKGTDLDGNEIALEKILFDEEDGFYFFKVNCLKSKKYNLGDCECTDHKSELTKEFDASMVYSHLSKIIRNENRKKETTVDKGARAKNNLEQLKKMTSEINKYAESEEQKKKDVEYKKHNQPKPPEPTPIL